MLAIPQQPQHTQRPFLPEPRRDFQALRNFPRLPDVADGHHSPQLTCEIRAAEERRPVAIDILETPGETPAASDIAATLSDDPEVVACCLRTRLSISLERQSRPGQPSQTSQLSQG